MVSSSSEMREDRPASERHRKKPMAKNLPPLPMCWNSTGILCERGGEGEVGRERGGGRERERF